jgi:thymidylate synthase (FAD)
MSHELIIEAENLLDKEVKVLNKGFIRLVDYMGGDKRIVQAARVSYGSGVKSESEDKKLINYLLKNLHTSPFEQVIFTFHIKCPIFVARQWVRHRTARLNELSGRYSVMKDDFYMPEKDDIRPQSKINKQGRDESSDIPDLDKEHFISTLGSDQTDIYKHYEESLAAGIAKEVSRINLPLSLYTEFYWQIDLHNLFHFLRLRVDSHAQKEIRVYGEVIANMVKAVCPVAFEAFEEHIHYGKRVSKTEYEELLSYKRFYEERMNVTDGT